jgi:hypothetical protein
MSDATPAFNPDDPDAPRPSFGRRGLKPAAEIAATADPADAESGFGARGLPAHLAGAVPDWALGTLGIKAREGLVAMGVTAVLLLGAVAGDFALGWTYHGVAQAFAVYGEIERIPPEAMPFGANTWGTLSGLGWVVILGAFAGNILLLVTMTLFRHGLEAVVGKGAFHWSWGWTIGGAIVPLWNFYRPWIAYAEVRCNAVALAREPYRLERPDFDVPTFLMALLFFAVSVAIGMVGARVVMLHMMWPVKLASIESVGFLLLVTGILRAVWSFAVLGYLYSIWSLLQQARIAIIELEPFS